MSTLDVQFPPGLAQTNMFKLFTTKDFNNKFDIDETSKIDMDEAARTMGALLRKHELNDLIGVCNIHNHFKLNDNEIVLAKVSQNQIQLKALPVNSDLAHEAVPYMWAFDKETKKFFAYQFFDGKCDVMAKRFNMLADRKQSLLNFFADFIDLAMKFELEDVLGIFLIYRDLISYSSNEERLLEETNVALRVQRMVPSSVHENAITTHWTFSNDKSNEDICLSFCVSTNGIHGKAHDK